MNFTDDLNIFNQMWMDEKFNILVGSRHPNQDFYFGEENIWIVHSKINMWHILDELDLLRYIRFLNTDKLDFKPGYSEILMDCGVRSIKFCILKH